MGHSLFPASNLNQQKQTNHAIQQAWFLLYLQSMALEGQETKLNSARRSGLLRAQTASAREASLRATTPVNIRPPTLDTVDRPSPYLGRSDDPLSQTPELQSSIQPTEKGGAEGKSTERESTDSEKEKGSEGEKTEGSEGKKKDFALDTGAVAQEFLQAQGIKAKLQAARTELKRQAANQVKQKVQKEVKQAVKAGVKRGVIYIADSIGASLDMSTAGISTLVDVFMYLFTFGWLNVEMIYGTFIAGGKSNIIAPLTVDPIPVPFEKKTANLMAVFLLLAADVFLGIVGTAVILFACTLLYVVYILMSNPVGAAEFVLTNGFSTEFLSIIKSLLNL